MKFREYMEMNPRKKLTKDEMKDFFEYAKQKYAIFDQVNWESYEDIDELPDMVEDYLGDSMEAILLFKEFVENPKTRRRR